jgi:thiol-disulfide isomerase/thioredoxin
VIRPLLLALLLLAGPAAADDTPQPFGRGSWQALRAAHAGKPTIVHIWGLTCAPCLVEMPQWAKLKREHKGLDLVLIAADPVPEDPGRAAGTLAGAGLTGVESWIFADRFAERLRYEIDPRWRGELPVTVLIDRAGTVTTMPGVADMAQVRAWLAAQP